MTTLISSHLLTDLERACDYLVLLSASRVQLSATVDDLLAEHRVVTGPAASAGTITSTHEILQSSGAGRQTIQLVRGTAPIHDPALMVRPAGLEELVLAYMNCPLAGAAPALALTAPEGSSR
jgi:ABC-2 type transport system ATP-binding protein